MQPGGDDDRGRHDRSACSSGPSRPTPTPTGPVSPAHPFGSLDHARVTDVLWTAGRRHPSGAPVGVGGGRAEGRAVGARRRGRRDFTTSRRPPASPSDRGVLAASTPPDTVYVLNDRHARGRRAGAGAGVYQVDAPPALQPIADRVVDVPDVLDDQGFYDMAIAVDPANSDRVVVAGATFDTTNAAGVRLRRRRRDRHR